MHRTHSSYKVFLEVHLLSINIQLSFVDIRDSLFYTWGTVFGSIPMAMCYYSDNLIQFESWRVYLDSEGGVVQMES